MVGKLPSEVIDVLTALISAGYQAYVVGGAVRDILLKIVPQDFDIATTAPAKDVKRIALEHTGWDCYEFGSKFGVVAVRLHNMTIEVATLRGETYGKDAHRPERVWFASSIVDDLARRDFTVNALAVDLQGHFIDLFDGQNDLNNKVLRTVGNPEKRFCEDALRMFRAGRFVAQLGFTLTDHAYLAIEKSLDRVNGLSVERITQELNKTLLAPYAAQGLDLFVKTKLAATVCRGKDHGVEQLIPILPELEHLFKLPQNRRYHRFDAWQHTLAVVKGVPANLILRWAALLHDIGKGLPGVRVINKAGQPADYGHEKVGAELAHRILVRLRVQPQLTKRIVWLIASHMRFGFHMLQPRTVSVRWVRHEAQSGQFRSQAELAEAFSQLVQLCLSDVRASRADDDDCQKAVQYGKALEDIAKNMPVHTTDLAISGADLQNILGEEKRIGIFLHTILKRVQEETLTNEYQTLKKAAYKWILHH